VSKVPSEQFLYLASIDDNRPKATADYILINQVVYKMINGNATTASDKRYAGPFSIDAKQTFI